MVRSMLVTIEGQEGAQLVLGVRADGQILLASTDTNVLGWFPVEVCTLIDPLFTLDESTFAHRFTKQAAHD